METPSLDSSDHPATARPADRVGPEGPGRLLPSLWLATAAGFLVIPFVTQYSVRSLLRADALEEGAAEEVYQDFSVDGWAQVDGHTGLREIHEMPVGILFTAVAALLVFAAVAAITGRGSAWPTRVGLLTSTTAATVCVLQLLELEARLHTEFDDALAQTDVTIAPAAWLIVPTGVLAAVAATLSIVRLGDRRRWAPRRPTPRAVRVDRPTLILLCLTAAIVLVLAPFPSFYQAADADNPALTAQVDGWDRALRSVAIPCTVLALGMAVTAIAMAVRRSAAWALRIGLLLGTAAATVAWFHVIGLATTLAAAGSGITMSIGFGGWMVLAAGVLGAVTAALALVRQRAQEAR